MRTKTVGYALTLAAAVTTAALAGGCDNSGTTSNSSSTPAASPSAGSATTTPTTGAAAGATGAGATGNAAGANAAAAATEATATIEPSKAPGQDNVAGTVRFTPTGTGVKIHAEITGLSPNGTHGFHIHEKADLSAPDLASAGPHFNPTVHKHGGPQGAERHGGDMGNLTADASGKATLDVTVEGLTLDESKTGVINRSVLVHEKADDLKTDPSGNSGARIAGGVIKAGGSK